MKSLEAVTYQHWKFMLLVFIFMLVSCAKQDRKQSSAPSWQGITLGETTSGELKVSLGEPDQIKANDEADSDWYQYPNHLGYINDPHIFEVSRDCDCVIRMAERGVQEVVIEDMLDRYGAPEVVVGSSAWLNHATFVNASQGIAYVAAVQSADGAYVREIMYFMPTTTNKWLQTSSGIHLPREPQPLWEAYAYEP